MIKDSVTLVETINFLNELTNLDRDAMERLIRARVPCNEKMADHATVQVGDDDQDRPVVGFLGVINGLFGVDERNYGQICAVFRDDNGLSHFAHMRGGSGTC
jgi:hypothetical protein